MKIIILTILALVTLACGRVSEEEIPETPAASPTAATPQSDEAEEVDDGEEEEPTPTPTPVPPTVVTFGFNNSTGICNAVRTWNPLLTTIVFPTASGGAFIYTFEGGVVYISAADGSGKGTTSATIVKSNLNSTVCTIVVTNGALISVTP